MHLLDIAQMIDGKLFGENIDICSVSIDSRSISKGQTFLALSGPNFDGNDFTLESEKNGAIAAIVERKSESLKIPQVIAKNGLRSLTLLAGAYRKLLTAKVCAITGSSGKTSVKGMLRSICLQVVDDESLVVSTYKNFNNHIGVPLTLLSASNDSRYLIVEAGTSNKGEIGPLAEIIDANVALVNNIGPSHIEAFETLDAIAEEKAEIYKNSSNNATCIINADDSFYSYFQNYCSLNRQRSFSTESASFADVYAKAIELDHLGRASFNLYSKQLNDSVFISLGVLGEHHVSNALAAASCALSMDIPLGAIKKGLGAFVGEPGRMQCHRLGDVTLIDDSYNANPESMKAAIQFLSHFEKTILIVGDMGELGEIAEEQHKKIGFFAKSNGINQLYSVGMFSEHYSKGFGDGARMFENRKAIIDYLKNDVLDKNVVLVKGSRSTKMDYIVKDLLELKEGS